MMDVGVIDVGSHTVRLLLARRDDGRIQPLRQEKAALGLGAEVERLGRLSEEKIAEAASLVGSFARIARKAGAVHVETVVTAPGRQSANGEDLVRALHEASGAPVRVLSPDEEGRLAFSGAVHGMALEGESVAVCDIGGGSTEIVVGSRGGEPAWVRSVDVGALRLTGRYLDQDPPSRAGAVAGPPDRRARVLLADAAPAEGRPRRRGNGACAAKAGRRGARRVRARSRDRDAPGEPFGPRRQGVRDRPRPCADARGRRSDPRGGPVPPERAAPRLAHRPA